jgi:hypothetical protein
MRVQRAEDVILTHSHPHLLALGPFSRLMTEVVSRFDRARDRTAPNLPCAGIALAGGGSKR